MAATTTRAHTHDLTRDEIISRFHDRVERGERVKLTREERESLALLLVDRLVQLQESGEDTRERVEKLCGEEKALLEKGYPVGSISSVYLPTYTRLVKDAIAVGRLVLNEQNSYAKGWTKRDGSGSGVTQTHHALDFLVYDYGTQVELRNISTQKNNERQDDLQPVQLEAYLGKVKELMESDQPELLAIAIAALTGRRFAEVVAVGRFSTTKHPYLVHFEGQQKKDGAIGFDILSLVEAKVLLALIGRFRSLPGVRDLVGLDDDHSEVQLFNNRVNVRVKNLFQKTGLVPLVKGFKTVSIHRLRAIYGAIAIHFWCANNQHVHRFLQHYLGHVLTGEVGVSNSRATDHYFHYYLVKGDGTPITARGVKLMANPLLPEPMEETELEQKEDEVEDLPEIRRHSLLRIEFDSRDRWLRVLSKVCPSGSQQEQSEALLGWVEERLNEPEPVAEPIPQQIQQDWIKEQFEAMQKRLDAVERSTNVAQLEEEVERLRAENERLRGAEQKLQQFKQLLGDGGEAIDLKDEVFATSAPQRAIKSTPIATSTEKPIKSGGAIDRAIGILEAVKVWNGLHPEKSFAITQSMLKDDFGIHFKATQEFLKDYQAEIEELHQASGVNNTRSHNRQLGRNIEELKQFVDERARDGERS